MRATPGLLFAAMEGLKLGYEHGGIYGALGAAGLGGTGYALKAFRAAGVHDVQSMVSDALLNPDRARQYLKRVPATPREKVEFQRVMRRSVLSASAIAQSSDDPLARAAGGPVLPARAAGGAVQPTEAQARAGNYRMEHRRFAGMDVTIETPKGATRSGIGPDGKPWSVRMPVDYSYLRGTVGADGDHLDVFLGPDEAAPYAFIIRQMHLHPRRFDEFKVMLGFKDRAKAIETYERGFSDGKGAARIGGIMCKPIATFPDWAKSEAAAEGKEQPQARVRGGGLFGMGGGGNGPFGVPTFGTSFGTGGGKRPKQAFAAGGAVSERKIEELSAAFQRQLDETRRDMDRDTRVRAEHQTAAKPALGLAGVVARPPHHAAAGLGALLRS